MELIGSTWQPYSVKGSTPLMDASKIQLHQKKFSKKFEKPLDKQSQVWYNKDNK